MEDCRSCGAHLFEGSSFCARCLTPVEPAAEEVSRGIVEVAAAGGRWIHRGPTASRWRSDPRYTEPLPPKEHSRWKASPVSFPGPVKVALTVAVVFGIPYLFYAVAGALALGPIAIWSIIVTPRSVRDLWRRSRVR